MKKTAPVMTRQSAKPRAGSHKHRGGMLVGIFVGLVLGVLIAAGVVWYLNRTPNPFQNKEPRVEKVEPKVAAGAPGNAAPPQPLPGKPGEKPRFEFYKILPGGQEPAPGPTAAPPADNAATATPPVTTAAPSTATSNAAAETFYLQIGAFQKAADADNLKAKLALVGVEAKVQEVTVADKGKLQRVRTGPYAKVEEMNRVRNQLSQNGIQATVIKVKDAN